MDSNTSFVPLPTSSCNEDTPTGRSICQTGCGRPSRVCLCAHLPSIPLPTSTTVLILHHPQALRRNPLSTLPLLARSLSNLRLLPGRRLLPCSSPLLPPPPSPSSPVLFLFPSPSASDLSAWCQTTPPSARANPILVLVDGTWKQAKEMAAASLPFLSPFATPVSLPCEMGVDGDSTFESELVLRKEPYKGCVSTMEAVARALRVLEPEGRGSEIEDRLVEVLRTMVAFQAEHLHLRPIKPRVKMMKKKDIKKEEENGRDVGLL